MLQEEINKKNQAESGQQNEEEKTFYSKSVF